MAQTRLERSAVLSEKAARSTVSHDQNREPASRLGSDSPYHYHPEAAPDTLYHHNLSLRAAYPGQKLFGSQIRYTPLGYYHSSIVWQHHVQFHGVCHLLYNRCAELDLPIHLHLKLAFRRITARLRYQRIHHCRIPESFQMRLFLLQTHRLSFSYITTTHRLNQSYPCKLFNTFQLHIAGC